MNASEENPLVFVGTYGDAGRESLFTFRMNPATGALVPIGEGLAVGKASYLALHPDGRHLYAVNELASPDKSQGGLVSAFALDPVTGGLRPLNAQSSQGAHPCHLCVAPGGRLLLVANYSSGTIGVLPVASDGSLEPARQALRHEGRGPVPVRQTQAHVHSVAIDPAGRHVLVCDLGIDRVMVYRLDAARGLLQPNDPPWVDTKPGAGPRHLVFVAGGRRVIVANELDSTVSVFGFEPASGVLTARQSVSTLPAGFTGANTCAAIRLHPNGRYVYVTNRGHDSIAVFDVEPETGALTPRGHVASGGRAPRDATLDPSGAFLLVAHQGSNTVVVFRVDPVSGLPEPTGASVTLPKPVCVLFG